MNKARAVLLAARGSFAFLCVTGFFAAGAQAQGTIDGVRTVRKPDAYWSAYRTETIRQVFDGAFGGDVADSRQFQYLYAGYVQTFSSRCERYLPPEHRVLSRKPPAGPSKRRRSSTCAWPSTTCRNWPRLHPSVARCQQ
jgi:hypothetical protein